VARSTPGAHAAVPILFQSPVTRLKRKERRTGFTAIRMRSLNDPHQGSLPTALLHLESGANGFRRSGADRETRYTLEPAAAAPASGANRVIRPHPPADCDSRSRG
jgi:hypothetical protein